MKFVEIYKKIRKVWKINPKTRFKKGNKKKRRRDKQRSEKELRRYEDK